MPVTEEQRVKARLLIAAHEKSIRKSLEAIEELQRKYLDDKVESERDEQNEVA